MLVSALRYTRKFNLGNYESEDIAIEAVPDDGQSAEELLAACRDFVLGSRGLAKGAPVANGNGKAPPLANGKGKPAAVPVPPGSAEEAPFDSDGSDPTTASTNGSGKKKRGRGRPPKAVTEARKAVQHATESANLEELRERYEAARKMAEHLDVDEWDAANKAFADVYRSVNSPDCNPDTVAALIAAFKAEKSSIETRRSAANG